MKLVTQERPILFSGVMVRAIFAGQKTQTRRVVRLSAELRRRGCTSLEGAWVDRGFSTERKFEYLKVPGPHETSHRLYSPHGVPGEKLWVREALRQTPAGTWVYAADGEALEPRAEFAGWAKRKQGRHCPSMHMPRWASRITLEIASVRVQRLRQISNQDAWEEGCRRYPEDAAWDKEAAVPYEETPRAEFAELWDSFDRKPSEKWAGNPWVWVVEFAVCR